MKKILKFAFVLSLFALPAWADALIYYKLFAKKSENPEKKTVFVWNDEEYSCNTPSAIYFKTEEEAKDACARCPNREVRKESGGDEYGHLILNGKNYYSCDNEDCCKCSEEGWCCGDLGHEEVKDVYACVLKSICPSDKPQLDTFGFCHSCNEENGIDVSWLEPGRGLVCNNREVVYTGDGERYSVLKKCPPERPLKSYLGKCYSCDELNSITVKTKRGYLPEEKDFCSLVGSLDPNPWHGKQDDFCPNRVNIEYNRWKYHYSFSILKDCPSDMPLRDKNGGCHACDDSEEITLNDIISFWGEIRCGKVYDANLNLIGTIGEGTPDEKDKEKTAENSVPQEDVEYIWNIYDTQNKQTGFVKVKYPGLHFDSFCSNNRVWEGFSAKLYDIENNLIAFGKGLQNCEDPKNTLSSYYFENVSDKVCPNREIYRKEAPSWFLDPISNFRMLVFNPPVSRLKK